MNEIEVIRSQHPKITLTPTNSSDEAMKDLQVRCYLDDFQTLLLQCEQSNLDLSSAHLQSLTMLAKASEMKDDDTGVHITRMAEISALIAKAHGKSDSFCKLILHASPMHDIGKIGVPDSILKKPGPLTVSEWKVMKEHPIYGYEILKGSTVPVIKMAAEIALNHHEKYDGSGYPSGFSGAEIPLSAQIVALADFFDALSMDRCYRKAMPDNQILSLIEEASGKHFSPELVDSFFTVSDEIILLRNKINSAQQPSNRQ